MGVIFTDLTKRWPLGFVPYECLDDDDGFTEGKIEEFNSLVGWPIFQPRVLQVPHYLIFQWENEDGHSGCKIGCEKKAQKIHYKKRRESIHHEMAHALGLGHENFNTRWPRWPEVRANAAAGNWKCQNAVQTLESGKYKNYLDYDPLSIMRYGPLSFGVTADNPPFVKNLVLSQGDLATIKHLFPAPLDQTYHSLPGSKPFATVSMEKEVIGHKFANTLTSQLISLDRIARSSGLRIFVLAGNDQRLDKLSQVALQVVKALATNNGFRLRVTAMMHSTDEVRIYSV
jgi:hypothetical protein